MQVNPTLARTRAVQQHNGSIKCGRREPIATAGERDQLNQAIIALRNAKDATNETHFLKEVRTAFTLSRNVFRGRNDV